MTYLLGETNDNASNNSTQWQDLGVEPLGDLVMCVEKLRKPWPKSRIGVVLHSCDGHSGDGSQEMSLLLEKTWWKKWFLDIAINLVKSKSN